MQVSVRAQARHIGLRAMVTAAQQLAREQAAGQEQRLLQAQLVKSGSVDPTAVAKLAGAAAGDVLAAQQIPVEHDV